MTDIRELVDRLGGDPSTLLGCYQVMNEAATALSEQRAEIERLEVVEAAGMKLEITSTKLIREYERLSPLLDAVADAAWEVEKAASCGATYDVMEALRQSLKALEAQE